MTMLQTLTLLESEAGVHHLPIPAWGFGLLAFVLLCAGLAYVLHIGSGRPHS